jgi:methylamine dehydrogenase heavy chain
MVFVADIALSHVVDGRLHVFDAKNLRYLGLIGTANAGMVHLPPGTKDIYVATTHLTRTTRGDRVDVLEIHSGEDLSFREEIAIANTRAQALNYRSLIWPSSDRKYMFIQNATPATSVSIVDLVQKKQTGEAPNPGCYAIFPGAKATDRFATPCGDGTFGTITIGANGTATGFRRSAQIFDADKDPIFISGVRWGDFWTFVSFGGKVYIVDVDGETARVVDKFAFAESVAGGWRPGGYQPHAVHEKSGIAYVLMHAHGREGSHKDPAEEIWAVDLAAKKVVGRARSIPSTLLAVGQDDAPVLYAIDANTSKMTRFEVSLAGGKLTLTATATAPAGDLPDQIEVR